MFYFVITKYKDGDYGCSTAYKTREHAEAVLTVKRIENDEANWDYQIVEVPNPFEADELANQELCERNAERAV